MRYFIINFKKEVPNISGMKMITSLNTYSVFSFENDQGIAQIPSDVRVEEIEELEATEGVKFYGQPNDHRRAYSDVEGLEPDPDELAKGKRKTKIYFTPQIYKATLKLMKRIFINVIKDELDRRGDHTREKELVDFVNSLKTIKEVNIERERLIGIEMPKSQAIELGLWDTEKNRRKGDVDYGFDF